MSCTHTNPPGQAFCSTCGESLPHVRCRCGSIASITADFCGRCGAALLAAATLSSDTQNNAQNSTQNSIMASDHRFDLVRLAEQAVQENLFLEATHKPRVTQDDIRKLLAKRRGAFR